MKRAGFTLIELLISIILMVILLGAITLIFVKTTDTVTTNEARLQVYTNARYALDTLENDLMSCLPFSMVPVAAGGPPVGGAAPTAPVQAFWMRNGPTSSGGHIGSAQDWISFRCVAPVGDQMQTCQVTYRLIPRADQLTTARTGRPLFVLVREVLLQSDADPTIFDKAPEDSTGFADPSIAQTELCHYVISFNLEYYADTQNFSQLEPPNQFPSTDPLGDGRGANDTVGTALRVPYVRATLVIVEDVGERQERSIQKAMWIPTG